MGVSLSTLFRWLQPLLREWIPASTVATSGARVLPVPAQVSHSSFRCAAVGVVSHPTHGLFYCIRTRPSSAECDHMDTSRGSEPEFTRFGFNLCCISVPAARIHRYPPHVSLPPSRALPWPLPCESFQVICG